MTRDDGRIPVVFGSASDRGAGDVVVHADGATLEFPARGCVCCVARGNLAKALGSLFLQNMRGEVSFRRVVVVARDPAGARSAMITDRFVSARFKLPDDGKDLIISPLPL